MVHDALLGYILAQHDGARPLYRPLGQRQPLSGCPRWPASEEHRGFPLL